MPPVPRQERLARVLALVGLVAVVGVVWLSRVDEAQNWVAKELRVLPRLTLFLTGLAAARIISGARIQRGALLFAGGAALLAMLALTPWHAAIGTAARSPRLAGFDLLRLELAFGSAVALGLALGRGIQNAPQLLALLMVGAAGDIWMTALSVPETVPPGHPLAALRLPWFGSIGRLGLCPLWTDIFLLAAAIEAARQIGVPMLSLSLSAIAGYAAGSFLGLDPWPAWPTLSVLFMTTAIVTGCWPDLRCSARDLGRAVLLGTVLFALLVGLAAVRRALTPPASPAPEVLRGRNMT